MPRVLLMTNDFYPHRGGIETFHYELARHFPPDEIVVYTRSMPGARQVDAYFPRTIVRDPSRMLVGIPAQGRRAVQAYRRFGCDRVIISSALPLGVLAPQFRHAGARRIVGITHGAEVGWSVYPGARTVLRRVTDQLDALTYNSDYCRRMMAAALPAAQRAKLRRLAPGVDSARFHPGCGGDQVRRTLGIEPSAPVAITVGRVVKRKGQDMLLRAWPAVLARHPDARLLIVGDGPDIGLCRRLMARLRLSGSVLFKTDLSYAGDPSAMPAWVDAADVFVLPSRDRMGRGEGLGIVFIEAASTGLPVIAGNSGGASDTLRDGVTGFLVDGRRPRDIARRLNELFDDAALRERMGQAGRAMAVRDWQWNDIAARAAELVGLSGSLTL